LGSHFASMNQYEKPSESNAQHKSLMRERRSMPQYLAVTIQLRLKKIYFVSSGLNSWVFELPLPKMFVAAASGISDWGSISSSSARAKQLAKNGVVSVGGESYSEVL